MQIVYLAVPVGLPPKVVNDGPADMRAFTFPARGNFYRNASVVRAKGDEYRAHLSRCEWGKEQQAEGYLGNLYYTLTTDGYGATDATPAGAKSALTVRECEVADAADRNSFWYIQRVGPLVSTGGELTHFLSWDDPGHLGARIPEGGRLFMNGYVARAVDAQGEPYGYPPIHQHHAHLNPDINPYQEARVPLTLTLYLSLIHI